MVESIDRIYHYFNIFQGFIEETNKKVDNEWLKRQEVFTKRNPEELPPWLADMPRQTIKQIEEEEAAIRAVILKEEVEGKVILNAIMEVLIPITNSYQCHVFIF